ncbi:hypothetical protein BGAL_0319g00120 [Botrytis galanthina]|uniref:Uncharacterized protein n=1 Tax=Botrytis galanthina TaxID=278940 RepID=A0A4S8QSQ7_9HELO|nr:hypothetical protein BGAL_0319g00120 [Botrytis galanthina]
MLNGDLVFFGGTRTKYSGATVFPGYGAFNLSYAMIHLPGSVIMTAYTDPETGQLNGQVATALAMYLWA